MKKRRKKKRKNAQIFADTKEYADWQVLFTYTTEKSLKACTFGYVVVVVSYRCVPTTQRFLRGCKTAIVNRNMNTKKPTHTAFIV